jgi:MFS family permease
MISLARALRHRNYRLFFAGQGTSLIGTWLTRVATAWLVYRLTHSALLLGVVGFAGQIPTFLCAPFAGVLVDRWNRHRLLVLTQIFAMIQSALLAYFALRGTITVWHILVLNAGQGVINAFDMPARQAFLLEMIEDRADLPNAIALNSSMVNGARLIGPTAAGALIAAFGEGGCFTVDALSYLAVIVSLLAMRLVPRPQRPKQQRAFHELGEGLGYVARSRPIRSILLLLGLTSLMGMPYMVLLPVIVGRVLGGGPHLLGYMTGASGVGALAGALYLASKKSVLGLGRVLPLAALGFGVGLIALSRSHTPLVSLPLMLVTGAGMMVQMATSNTLIQTIVDDEKRGRVMSLYAVAFFGTAPFGSLLAGTLATHIGAPDTLAINGVTLILGAAWFARLLPKIRDDTRPIYQRLGILPPIAEGLGAASEMTVPPED